MKNHPKRPFLSFQFCQKRKTLLFNAPKNHVLRDADNLKAIKSPQNCGALKNMLGNTLGTHWKVKRI
jgi:hypothetical protein